MVKKSFVLTFVFILHLALITEICLGQWEQTGGLGVGSVRTLAVSGTNIFAGTQGGSGVYLSTNSGINWTVVNNGINNLSVFTFAISGTNILAGTYGGGVFISTNNGTSWVELGLTNQNVISLIVSGTNIFAGTNGAGIFLSTNNGLSWAQVNNGLTNLPVNALTISGTYIFASTFGGGVFLSTNNGLSWAQVNNGLTNLSVNALTVLGSYLFAGTLGGGVFLSTNNGLSWAQVNNGLTDLNVNALTVSGTNIFAGTNNNGGVFLSTNNGASWIQKNQGFGYSPIVGALLVANNHIFAGTGLYIWRRSISDIVGVQNISTEIPTSFSLEQNYPNPFNSMTNIKFQIINSGNVKITVFDILGKEIATLVNEQLQPGTYETTFDASQLTSGVYFYKITAGEFSAIRKMVLVR